ncbi:hypothetical protein [Actinoplanes sp. NPDC051494]|uniref:hypothetical protein n=1 Tax=Actinoplanes sp. NPDC051494 TaxID=3363907 RepID=UPI003789E2AC
MLSGFAQALPIWLAVLTGLAIYNHDRPAGPDPMLVHVTALVVGLAATVALAAWHRRRGRTEPARGAFAGALAWPMLLVAVVGVAGVALAD